MICFKNQAMFAQVKIDCYYRVTTDSILGYIAIEMKKALRPLIHNDFKTYLLVIHRRFELRTPWLKVKCSTDWASGSFGRGSRIRTYAWRSQSPLPYRLAIPLLAPEAGFEPATSWLTVTRSTGWAIQESIETSYDVTNYGAENGTRTRDPNLGKVVLYHWATSAFA